MLSDLKFAFRSLRKTPGFTAVAVLTLALGIGANTAIFSLIKFVLINPYPYPQPQQLMFLWQETVRSEPGSIAWPDLRDWQRENNTFSAIGGFRGYGFTLTGNGMPEMLRGGYVNATLFDAMGLPPAQGRLFSPAEDKPGAPALVVLSHEFWQRRFAGNPNVVGQTLHLNREAYEVVGILPPEFSLFIGADVLTQLGRLGDSPQWQSRGVHPGIYAVGRIKPGFGPAQALTDLKQISERVHNETSAAESGESIVGGRPLIDAVVGPHRQGMWMLFAASGLVLLIACVNVASLLFARGVARQKEFAIRAALGASGSRLLRESLVESLLLAVAGGVVGLLLATVIHDVLVHLVPSGGISFKGLGYLSVAPLFERAHLDGGVLAAALVLSLFTVVVFGWWPALRAARPNLLPALGTGGRLGSSNDQSKRSHETLVIAEVALTLILLVGAGLLLKSFARIHAVDLGFDSHNVLTARMLLSDQVYATDTQARGFVDRVIERLQRLPGVQSAQVAYGSPLMPAYQTSFSPDDRPHPVGSLSFAEMNHVSDGYFETLKIPLLQGRTFGPQDEQTEPVIIIDKTTAEKYWPAESALGKRIRFGDNVVATVVGVVPTLRLNGYAVDSPLMQGYFSLRQKTQTSRAYMLLVRADRNVETLKTSLRHAVLEINPEQPLWDIRPMDDRIAESSGMAKYNAFLLSTFAALALLLATVGLYGVLAFQVGNRTREFGIRMALGSPRARVMKLVLRRGLSLVAVGVAIGIVGALLLGRVLSSLLYRTSMFDPAVIIGVAALFAAITLLACWLPARRATKVDPAVALRAE